MIDLLVTGFIVAVSLYGYVVYGIETQRRVLRPRAATWLIWAILGTCVSVVQLRHGAGLGAVVTIVAAAANYVLAAMAWRYGHRTIRPIDILSSIAALAVVILWMTASDTITVVFATLTYLFGFIPTFERAYRKPYDENVTPFFINIIKYLLAIGVMARLEWETVLYPLVLAAFNVIFMGMVLYRRHSKRVSRKSVQKPLAKKNRRRYNK